MPSAAAVVVALLGASNGHAAEQQAERIDHGFTPTPLPVGAAYHLFVGAGLGGSLRFNNPYRLGNQLGSSPESVSAPSPYFNARMGATMRRAGWVAHGAELDASFALGGVPQEVITPSYLAVFHVLPRWVARGRAGIPIVIEPDANVGFEMGAGGVFFATAALGVTLDLVGSLFFGAATVESARTAIPLISLELGFLYDYEVLP